jgi:hypothetical protein
VNNPAQAVRCVRDWLNSKSGRRTIPGGTVISARYVQFQDDLPEMCAAVTVTEDELTYNDYTNLVSTWLSTREAED